MRPEEKLKLTITLQDNISLWWTRTSRGADGNRRIGIISDISFSSRSTQRRNVFEHSTFVWMSFRIRIFCAKLRQEILWASTQWITRSTFRCKGNKTLRFIGEDMNWSKDACKRNRTRKHIWFHDAWFIHSPEITADDFLAKASGTYTALVNWSRNRTVRE